MSRNCPVGKNLSLDCLFTADETQRVSRKLECQKLRTEFVKEFGSAHCLRHYPPSDESFNPRASVALIITFLHNLAPSEALFRARMYSLMYRVRRIGRWMRRILKARDDQKEKILHHWMENDSEKKKTAYTKLCRECRILPPGQCKPSIETYNKYQITEQDRKQAVAWVYELKRKLFRTQFHAWYVSSKASEVEHKEKLQMLCQRNLFSWNSGNRNITNALSSDFSGELDKLERSRPVFDFSVASITKGELHEALSKIRSANEECTNSMGDEVTKLRNEVLATNPSLPPLCQPVLTSVAIGQRSSDLCSASASNSNQSSCRSVSTKLTGKKGSMSSEGTSISSRSSELCSTPKSSGSNFSSSVAAESRLTPLHNGSERTTFEHVSEDGEAFECSTSLPVIPVPTRQFGFRFNGQSPERQESFDPTILRRPGNTTDASLTVSYNSASLALPHEAPHEHNLLLTHVSGSPKLRLESALQRELPTAETLKQPQPSSVALSSGKFSRTPSPKYTNFDDRFLKRNALSKNFSSDAIPLGRIYSPPRRRNLGTPLSPLISALKIKELKWTPTVALQPLRGHPPNPEIPHR